MCGRQSDPGEGQVERRLYEGPVEHGKQKRLGSHHSERTNAFGNRNRTDRGRGRSGVPGSVPRLTGTATNVNILMKRNKRSNPRKEANIKPQGSPRRTRQPGGSPLGGGAGGAGEQGVVGERDYYITEKE